MLTMEALSGSCWMSNGLHWNPSHCCMIWNHKLQRQEWWLEIQDTMCEPPGKQDRRQGRRRPSASWGETSLLVRVHASRRIRGKAFSAVGINLSRYIQCTKSRLWRLRREIYSGVSCSLMNDDGGWLKSKVELSWRFTWSCTATIDSRSPLIT